MKELAELTIGLKDNLNKQKALKEKFDEDLKKLIAEQSAWTVRRQLILNDVNIDHVSVAEKILDIQGNPSNTCEGQQLTRLAAEDLASGVIHLRRQYFGNKRYDGYYQRNDSEYGYGPKHGSIVERVGLLSKYRTKELTTDQVESCIYYLLNFDKIYKSKKEVA